MSSVHDATDLKPTSEPPDSGKSDEKTMARLTMKYGKNVALAGCAVAIAAQIPSTLELIDNPIVRVCMQLVAVVVVITLGVFAKISHRE